MVVADAADRVEAAQVVLVWIVIPMPCDDVEGRVADMECLPTSLAGRRYYVPTQEGREKLLAQRMDEIARIKAAKHE